MTVGSQVVTPSTLEPTEIAAGDLQLRVWDLDMVARGPGGGGRPRDRAAGTRSASPTPDRTRSSTARSCARPGSSTGRTGRSTPPGRVCDATSGHVLGYVSLHDLEPRHLSGEVGYWVLPEARGRGVGGASVAAAVGYAFGALGLNRDRAVPRGRQPVVLRGGHRRRLRARGHRPPGLPLRRRPAPRRPHARPPRRRLLRRPSWGHDARAAESSSRARGRPPPSRGHDHRRQPEPAGHEPELGRQLLRGVAGRTRLREGRLHEQRPCGRSALRSTRATSRSSRRKGST